MKDYYEILEVSPSATASEIRKAFRKLALQFHPDRNPSPEAAPRFHDINEAYDVLGNAEKRAGYDVLRANPLIGMSNEPPPHRDPAYRRRKAPAARKEPPPSFYTMLAALPYMQWISRIGLLVTAVFFVDYLLPYREQTEAVMDVYAVKSGSTVVHYIMLTESGRRLRLYPEQAWDLAREEVIRVRTTTIYGTVMSVSDEWDTVRVRLAYMYRHLLFLPIVLFVISLLALKERKRVELCFSLNLAGFILLIINSVLMFYG